jgi:ribosomal protein L37AE/L43A
MELSENTEKAVMAKNAIQFQKGLSLRDFLGQYRSEEQCQQTLYRLRWPQGFGCPACGNTSGCALHSRKVYQCRKCHHQTSLTAGAIFHGTKLALTQWFLAIFLPTQRQQSVSAMQLSRDLGVKYDTAWRIKHKLLRVMLERGRKGSFGERVEIDDAYLGGEMPGSGRKAAQHPTFNWDNTLLGNVKTALTDTCHAIREKHVPRYLAEVEYRFNRRFDLPAMIERLAHVALRTPPIPQRLFSMAE